MYKCDCCGREMKKKISLQGYILCHKHAHQLHKYGRFLDNIQRTNKDLNDYKIDGNITYVHCYNIHNEYIGDFIIDTKCLSLIKYHKWRLSHGYPITGFGKNQHRITYYLMNPKQGQVVDHINCNPLDNRLCNLRVCSPSDNVIDRSTITSNSNYTGVFIDKRRKYKRYCVEIHKKWQKLSLGNYIELSHAVYARFVAEVIMFGKYRNTTNDAEKFILFDNIPATTKFNIIKYVVDKIITKKIIL